MDLTLIGAIIVGIVAFVVGVYNLGQAVEWLREKSSQFTLAQGLRRETPEERSARVWLTVSGILPGMSGGSVIAGTKTRETSVSIFLKIVNRHLQNRVSLTFWLEDPDTSTRQIHPADAFEVALRGIPPVPGFPYRVLQSPLPVAPQEEIIGHLWFFFRGAPNQMPVKTLVFRDSIHGGEFRVDLPEGFYKLARTQDKPYSA
jgi:hypothetical protein